MDDVSWLLNRTNRLEATCTGLFYLGKAPVKGYRTVFHTLPPVQYVLSSLSLEGLHSLMDRFIPILCLVLRKCKTLPVVLDYQI